jgi:hypothetical protein
MKTLTLTTMLAALALAGDTRSQQVTNLTSDEHHAWGESIGHIDGHGPGAGGLLVADRHLHGKAWSENVGWIDFGSGPADGNQYANEDDTDFGVNLDVASGDLSGLAWGENIGWIQLDTASAGDDRARFDLDDLRLRGFAWGENIGWIALDGMAVEQAALPYSDGIASTGGEVAQLRAWGTLGDADVYTLAYVGGLPGTSTGFHFGLENLPTAFKGGLFHPIPILFSLYQFTDEQGTATWTLPGMTWDVPFSIYVQAGQVDPGAVKGISLSNPVEIQIDAP